MEMSQQVLDYVSSHTDELLDLLATLAKIPSPSNHEEKRAAFCKKWLENQGAKGVYIDDALNVIYPIGCPDCDSIVVFMAHTDVVFPDTEELPLVIEDGLMKAPGIGDDTANLAILLMAAKYITEKQIKPKDHRMLIVANSGEEGLGNLKGSRKIIKDFGRNITEFYSFDGANAMIVDKAVGSKRFKIEVTTEGGHSYGKFGNRNAIHYLASMIDNLYTMKVPDLGKTTYNVGMIKGGTSVNTIAQQAEMLYEFRSDNREALNIMDHHLFCLIESYRAKGVGVQTELLGERPSTGDVDQKRQEALTKKASDAIKKYFALEPDIIAGSTDCNIPLSEGIPSVCLGCYIGEGAHTREEWLKIDSLTPGMKMAFEVILSYF